MKTIVVLVKPEGEENIGLIARAMKNFGLSELILVNPKANHLSGKAKSRAMHAGEILRKAKIEKNLDTALKRADYAIATTAKKSKGKKLFRTALNAKDFAEKFSQSNKTFALVFGNERNGLNNEEIKKCDFIVSIPSHHSYRSMNLSHAAAIVFYELFQKKSKKSFQSMSKHKKLLLEKEFFRLLENAKNIHYKESVELSIKAFLGRSLLSEKEANALLSLLKGAKK